MWPRSVSFSLYTAYPLYFTCCWYFRLIGSITSTCCWSGRVGMLLSWMLLLFLLHEYPSSYKEQPGNTLGEALSINRERHSSRIRRSSNPSKIHQKAWRIYCWVSPRNARYYTILTVAMSFKHLWFTCCCCCSQCAVSSPYISFTPCLCINLLVSFRWSPAKMWVYVNLVF